MPAFGWLGIVRAGDVRRPDSELPAAASYRSATNLLSGSLGLGVREQAGCLEQPGVIDLAAGTAQEMNRGTRIGTCRVFPSQLEFDVDIENVLAGGAARIPVLGTEEFMEAMGIGQVVASASARTG